METSDSARPGWMKFLPLIGIVGVVLVGLVVWFSVNNGVTNKGNKQQNGLNAQYSDNINYLSDCIVRVNGSANVAQAQVGAFNNVLVEVVKGRYDNDLAAARPGDSRNLISAIVEDYPDMAPLASSFDKVINILNGCRTDYRDMQTKLLTRINSFDDWRTGSWTVRTFGGEYPSDGLRAKKGDAILKSDEALEQMRTVVVVAEANKAYETGVVDSPDPFGVNKPKG